MATNNSLIDLDALERIATIVWAYKDDSEMAAKVAAVRLVSDLWSRLSDQNEIEALRTATIMKISKYIKEHPRASKEELTSFIGKEITDFAEKVKSNK